MVRFGFAGSWRTALRVARRETARAKGRSALVIAMIALPVCGLGFAAASYDMFTLTPAERATRTLGGADAIVRPIGAEAIVQDRAGEIWSRVVETENPADFDVPDLQRMLELLPDGSRIVPVHSERLDLLTGAGGLVTAEMTAMDPADPIHRGVVELVDGRAPAGPGEVAMSAAARERFGDTVRTPDGSRTWTAVGTVEFPGDLGLRLVVAPGGLPGEEDVDRATAWLADTPAPIGWDGVRELNREGIMVTSRAVLTGTPEQAPGALETEDEPETTLSLVPLVIGLAVVEIVLLAGPAFAVGARHRRRSLALVAANGGTRAHLRRIVFADGILLGLAGAAAGLLLAVLLAVVARPLAENLVVGARAGGYRFNPPMLAAIVALAVVTGLLAATVPAFTAARADVITALAGRRGAVRSKRRWVITGLALVLCGAGTAVAGVRAVEVLVIVAGLAIVQFGLVLCTPALVGLTARLGGLLPAAPRIALRDTARNRAAAAPAVAAVMAAVAGTVAIGVYLTSTADRDRQNYHPALPAGHVGVNFGIGGEDYTAQTPELARAALTAALPGVAITEISETVCRPGRTTPTSCQLVPLRSAARTCPADENSPETPAEVARMAADPRCARWHSSQQYGYGQFLSVVGDRSTLAALTGASGPELDRAAAVLDRGGVVVNDPLLIENGMVTVFLSDPESPTGEQPTITAPGAYLDGATHSGGDVMSRGLAERAGFDVAVNGLIAATPEAPDAEVMDRLRAALATAGTRPPVAESGPDPGYEPVLWLLAGASALITLGAAAVATGLAAADGRADLATLAAIGASPGIRRALSVSQSGVIAGLGSVLGVLAGVGSGFAVLAATNASRTVEWPIPTPYPMSVPWLNLLLILIVPLVAMFGTGLLTRARLPIERRRPT
ncbi:MAG TPA: FtsX-like permease family protein [Actinoplanes sp.]|nr:FtsX-like permease family protein [Actinoplanes sp.]